MTMPAISLHQPWASLLTTRQLCDCKYPENDPHAERCNTRSMVKRFETRSWPCPPALIGQRIVFHATKQIPANELEVGEYACWNTTDGRSMLAETIGQDGYTGEPIADLFGEWLPLGAIVGSGRVVACYPIVGWGEWPVDGYSIWQVNPDLLVIAFGPYVMADITSQAPYGDFSPGRYAWLIEDAAPTTERCPWCWGRGWISAPRNLGADPYCTACKGFGRCDPIPARGHQRIWSWNGERNAA